MQICVGHTGGLCSHGFIRLPRTGFIMQRDLRTESGALKIL